MCYFYLTKSETGCLLLGVQGIPELGWGRDIHDMG